MSGFSWAGCTGIVLAQVTVRAKSNEIPAFAPLLDAVEQVLGSLRDLIFVADALHTQVNHAHEITRRGAHLLIPAKGNQPSLFAPLKALPWAQIPDRPPDPRDWPRPPGDPHRQSCHRHHPWRIGFPHAEQAIRITRTRTITKAGKTSRETAYLTITLPAADAHPADLQEWIRSEWLIETKCITSEM